MPRIWLIITLCSMLPLLLLAPGWAVYAILGLILGLILKATCRWFLAVRRRWLIAVNVMALGAITLVLMAVSIPSLMQMRDKSSRSEYTVHYSADISYQSEGPNWQIRDRLEVGQNHRALMERLSMIEEQVALGEADPEELTAAMESDWTWLVEELQSRGWIAESQGEDEAVFYRERAASAVASWFAVRSDTKIPLPDLQDEMDGPFYFYPYTELRFDVPQNVVGLTTPQAIQREASEAGREHRETIVVRAEMPMLPIEQGQPVVQVELLHPLLQNAVAAGLRQAAAVPALNWLIAGFCGVFSDRIRGRIFPPIADGICRVLGIAKQKPDPAVVAAIATSDGIQPRRTTRPPAATGGGDPTAPRIVPRRRPKRRDSVT